MSDKPYDYMQLRGGGEHVGWVDSDGIVHVETVKRWTANGVELEPSPDPVQRAYDTLSAALDEMLDVESGLREILAQDPGERQ